MNYGDKIRIAREKLNVTQKFMSESLGISQSYLSAIESGKMQANAKVILGLDKIFGVKAGWLAEESVENLPSGKSGTVFVRENESRYYASFIGEIGSFIEGDELILFRVASDNMEPLFLAGDEVLVDVSDKLLKNYEVYLFEIESERVLKRFVSSEFMRLTNDKPSQKNNDIILDSSVKCLGRAVWLIRKL